MTASASTAQQLALIAALQQNRGELDAGVLERILRSLAKRAA